MKYYFNMKYKDGQPNVDKWEEISEIKYYCIEKDLEFHAEMKGFDVENYMEFIHESVLKAE